jgi:hypothetical protein
MIKDHNIAQDAAISPTKILGLSIGVRDYFYVAPVDSQYYSWLRDLVPADRLFTTLALAHAEMTADRGDTALVYPGQYVQSTTALTWSKDQCHIIGVGPVHAIEHPVELTNGNADATPTTGNWLFTANECHIQNLCFRHRGAAANVVSVSISGDDNVFEDVHFHNMANTATAGAAGAKGLVLDGANNLVLRRCTIGGTEIERTASAADMTIGAGTCDDLHFYDCMWIADLDATADAAHAFIELVAAADLGKFAYFKNAMFINCGAAMDQLPDVITVSATMAGIMFFNGVTVVGALDLADNEEKVYVRSIGKDTTEGKFMVQAILTDNT